jgi:hypothetical protein
MKTLIGFGGVAVILAALVRPAAADDTGPLKESELLSLIGLKVSESEILRMIQERKVDFPLDKSTEKRLQRAGASEKVLVAVRQVAKPAAEAVLSLWVKREYGTWDNPLHSELTVNGKSLGRFSSDTERDVAAFIKPGWNTLVLKTTPQAGATKSNKLVFKVGPVVKQDARRVMTTTLWQFDNGTDWKFDDGKYTHQLGPDRKDATLTFRLFLGKLDVEGRKPAEGDYILRGRQEYATWNTPVTATVYFGDKPITSFLGPERTVVVTDLVHKGDNPIRVVSQRVPNVIANNDIRFTIAGPAEWNVTRGRFEFTPKLQFEAMKGWKRDPKSGKLLNQVKADEDTVETPSLSLTLDREPGKK